MSKSWVFMSRFLILSLGLLATSVVAAESLHYLRVDNQADTDIVLRLEKSCNPLWIEVVDATFPQGASVVKALVLEDESAYCVLARQSDGHVLVEKMHFKKRLCTLVLQQNPAGELHITADC
jgi:hypothetical protein